LRATPISDMNISCHSLISQKILTLANKTNSLTERNLAHDIKNALALFSLYLETSDDQHVKTDSINHMYVHVNKLLDVLNNKLNSCLSKSTYKQGIYELKRLIEYVNSYIEFIKTILFSENISLLYKFDGNITSNKFLFIDEYDLIFAILNNLITNSVKELLSDKNHNKIINVTINITDNSIIIEVSDTGKGFPSQVLESFKKDQRYTTF
ncbi:MAG: ATP-binding protein, partial [Candidatus Micrarchaeota archaeon]|nr:ATP-binding protein [Candidatus Micrarchaeota archaeon]